MAAKFDISNDHAGKFRFHLKAPNGGRAVGGGRAGLMGITVNPGERA
jgi:hypothetical protein